jgi:hypothetical protein
MQSTPGVISAAPNVGAVLALPARNAQRAMR